MEDVTPPDKKRLSAYFKICSCNKAPADLDDYVCADCGRFIHEGNGYESRTWCFGLVGIKQLTRAAERILAERWGIDWVEPIDEADPDIDPDVLDWARDVVDLADEVTNLDSTSAWELASALGTWSSQDYGLLDEEDRMAVIAEAKSERTPVNEIESLYFKCQPLFDTLSRRQRNRLFVDCEEASSEATRDGHPIDDRPKVKKRPGRPASKAVAYRREQVKLLMDKGKGPGEITADLHEMKANRTLKHDCTISVEAVKKDLRLIRKSGQK